MQHTLSVIGFFNVTPGSINVSNFLADVAGLKRMCPAQILLPWSRTCVTGDVIKSGNVDVTNVDKPAARYDPDCAV